MCYSDGPNYPTMHVVCPSEQQDKRFDCGHDDYFSTNPVPGSYLDSHWNTANNRFLIGAPALPSDAPSQSSPPQVGVETKKHNRSTPQVTVSATVSDTTGIEAMRFGVCTGASCSWDAAQQLGQASSAPYSVQWKLPKSGTFSFLAQAAYVDGSTAVSEPLTINHKAKKSKSKGRH